MLMLPLACVVSTLVGALNLPSSERANNQTSTANVPFIATDFYLKCNETLFGHDLTIGACNDAISLLPQDEPGDVYYSPTWKEYIYPYFTRRNQEARHRLPVTRQNGKCVVIIALNPMAYTETSSWRIISMRSQDVVKKCVERGMGIGGYVLTGVDKMIGITIKSSDILYQESSLENGTFSSRW